MIIRAVADLHGYLPPIERCDVLLIGGDIAPDRQPLTWYQTEFKDWLHTVPARYVIATPGNHDFILRDNRAAVDKIGLRWHLLVDEGFQVDGYQFYGSPWQLPFLNWAYNLPEYQIKEKWAAIPENTSVLVLHGPPYCYGDLTNDGRHTGSPSLLERIKELPQLKLVIYGHIHEARGEWHINQATLANVSVVNRHYQLVYPPFEYKLQDGNWRQAIKWGPI